MGITLNAICCQWAGFCVLARECNLRDLEMVSANNYCKPPRLLFLIGDHVADIGGAKGWGRQNFNGRWRRGFFVCCPASGLG